MENIHLSLTLTQWPLAGIDQFAQQCGVTRSSVEVWIRKGYVPSRKIGKRRLIDLAALAQQPSAPARNEVRTAARGAKVTPLTNRGDKKDQARGINHG